MKAHIIQVNGDVISYDNWPENIDERKDTLKQIVGGDLEYVAVLYEGEPATMIVNELGAVADPETNPGGLLAPNARATAIYWTATITGRTGADFKPLSAPMVHGHAVLIEKSKREL